MAARYTLAIAALVTSTAVVLAVRPCGAQVNAERLRPGTPEPGLHGALDGSLTVRRGNTDFTQAGLSGRLEWNNPVHTPLLHAAANWAEKGGNRFTNNAFVHARWTAMWRERVGTEVFAQLQYNEFIRLTSRALGGVGVRVQVLDLPGLDVFAGTGWMLERETLDLPATELHPNRTLAHRSTSYLTARFQLADTKAVLANTVYVQPRFDRPSDLRILNETTLEAPVWRVVFVVVGVAMRYDSDPPSIVRATDLELLSSLRVRF